MVQERVLSKDLHRYVDGRVSIWGWLHTLRTLGRVNFLIVRDGYGLVQVLVQERDQIQILNKLQAGSIVRVDGKVVRSLTANPGWEIVEPVIHVDVAIEEVPPIDYYKPQLSASLDVILDHRSIALRNAKIAAVFRIQAEIAHIYRHFMHDQVQAVEYFSPNLLGASSEGGAEFFHVDYFGYNATLAQSSQLYKQIMVGVYERVFALMPFFRAEPSHTPRHLSEGKQFEFEMGFFSNWHEILDIQEGCIKAIVRHLKDSCSRELETLECALVEAPEDVPFPRFTFAEAQQLIFERTGIDERNEPDLSPQAEKELCRYTKEHFGTDLVFIIDWRVDKRPFYAFPKEDHPMLTNTFDLLCGGTEITSGGQRRHTYASMVEGIKMKGMDPGLFEDYLSIFRYGMPPHGGFGMGLERLTMTLLGLKNIREASLFPSDPKRIASVRIKAKMFFGGESLRNEILRLLKENQLEFDYRTHEETPTSEDSARVRNTRMEEGVKSLILKGRQSKKNYQFNLPSHLKIDMGRVADIVGEKCDFEEPAIIKERFGLELGSVPPFGNLMNVETFYDERIKEEPKAAFNCGLRTESIIMRTQDLTSLVQPRFDRFSKN